MHPRPQLEGFLHLWRVGKREPLWAAAPLTPQHFGSLHEATAGPVLRYGHGVHLAASRGQTWSLASGRGSDSRVLRVLPGGCGVGAGGASHKHFSHFLLPCSSLPPTGLSETLSVAPWAPPEAFVSSYKVALRGQRLGGHCCC